MTIVGFQRHEVPGDDRAPASRVAEALAPVRDGHAHVEIVRKDGSRQQVEVPRYMAEAFQELAGMFAEQGRATVVDEEQELSPEEAATLLGMSRPMVVHRINQGDLPGRKVGTHHRIRMSDLLAFQKRDMAQAAAMAEFGEMTDELDGMTGGYGR